METAEVQRAAPAATARLVDAHTGPLGAEQFTAVEQFTRQLLAVYLPKAIGGRNPTSSYAKHRPVRTLLKAYRMYRNLPPSERRFMMMAELREIFLKPPQGIREPQEYGIEEKVQSVTDGFLDLLGFLYADIPSIVTRHENRLVHAIDLAVDLHYWDIYNEREIARAESLVRRIREGGKDISVLRGKSEMTDEDHLELKEKIKEVQDREKQVRAIAKDLREKAKREADASRIENLLKEESGDGQQAKSE